MAKFAEIKEIQNPFDPSKTIWKVQRVVAVGNSEVSYNGDVAGEEWCKKFFKGGTWKQTSYNTRKGIYHTPDDEGTIVQDPDQTKAFRHTYAGEGYVYDFEHDVFYLQQPYATWTLDISNFTWVAPVTYPSITKYTDASGNEIEHVITWDEPNQKWVSTDVSGINWEWNVTTSQWDSIS
jgi:hypothetical protein|tara:strand:- start:110 stop:646 length:537 start_codon:yes stop_codon:yes gene_type:complete